MKFIGIGISIRSHTLSPLSLIKNENISTMCWCGSELNVSGLICSAKLTANQVVAGGKELALRVWDINNHGSPIFTAKNVRSSVLELSVPIWISDVSVVPKSNGKLILTASRYGEIYVKVPVTSFLVRSNTSFANIENFLKKDDDNVSNKEEKVESSYGISKAEQKEFEDLWDQIPVVENDNDGVNEGCKRTTGLKTGKRRRKK
ncbi:hypothetical protein Smp_156570 [Schistosoma mansoni]|uniref:hypothetical protein n=1 Tax=Schistosoma mansoni TaxID=6183 RepID=UPI0001A6425E|nr:hypothetical protein Smp_156570 [Schistosoma mansoni]|eukprot:XP_018647147.1 hypothetical protein Smp_156570 [Schistosoma mansoni]